MLWNQGRGQALARSHGFRVLACDGVLGTVETPLFPPDRADPDYLLVRLAEALGGGEVVVPVGLVARVSAADGEIGVGTEAAETAELGESLFAASRYAHPSPRTTPAARIGQD